MPPIDDRTPKLDLPLPAQPNTLKNDVQRLRDTITSLDDKVVVIDPTTGKMDSKFLPDKVAVLVPPHATLDPAMLPPEVVTVDATGKIPEDKIPDDARTNIHDVASEVLMLELDASIGDVARVTGSGKTYMLMGRSTGLTAPQKTDRGDWKEQSVTAVTSVNGRTGDVVVAEPGINADITQLTKLSGPLTLGGDGASDNDAVTMRQLKGAMGTSGGASMTGVMNNFIGAVEWHNGPSTALPAGHHLANGQRIRRSEVPDIVAAMKNGMLNVAPAGNGKTSDDIWLDSGDAVRPYAWRSSYSWADGDANTGDWIRLPDLNGAGLNSIKHLFLSGSSGAPSEPSAGQIWLQSAPNILGDLFAGSAGSYAQFFLQQAGNFGAFSIDNSAFQAGTGDGIGTTKPGDAGNTRKNSAHFKANNSNRTYGRGSQYQLADGRIPAVNGDPNNVGDLYPNHAVGYWIIRTSGAFTAANSEFHVLNSAATAPATGQQIAGGKVTSQYQIAGKAEFEAQMWAQKISGSGDSQLVLSVANLANNKRNWLAYDNNGLLSGLSRISFQVTPPQFGSISAPGAPTSFNSSPVWAAYRIADTWVSSTSYIPIVGGGSGGNGGAWRRFVSFGALAFESANQRHPTACIALTDDYDIVNGSSKKTWAFQFSKEAGQTPVLSFADDQGQEGHSVTWNAASDETLKEDIQDYDGQQSLANIEAMALKTFVYKADRQKRVRRGVIAQQIEKIDPEYVHDNIGTINIKTLDSNVLLLDALAAIKVLAAQNKDLQAQIDELKAKP